MSEFGEATAARKNKPISLLQRFADAGLDVIKTENLDNERRRKRLFGIKSLEPPA